MKKGLTPLNAVALSVRITYSTSRKTYHDTENYERHLLLRLIHSEIRVKGQTH